MKKIKGFAGVAPKIKGGHLEYCLWVDSNGSLFFEITKNVTDVVTPGTYPPLLFKLADFTGGVDQSNIFGLNPESFKREASFDKNASGFIRAIVDDLLISE